MKQQNIADYIKGFKNKNITSLARAITLVESKKPEHKELARELIQKILPLTGKAKKIGITGTPGVGKSTFLENFGMYLIHKNLSVAVLAVDPTSQKTGGSILGDKTRMEQLSAAENAFIRPSPSGETLGGITAKTREAALLCDAFGFDYIFVETVGVGQSEVSVSHICDMFILLMEPGAGDDLQGIKRGILEVSDLVLMNKADGENKKQALLSQHDYEKSIDLLQAGKEWETKVQLCSSLNREWFDDIEKIILSYFSLHPSANSFDQLEVWLKDLLKDKFLTRLNSTSLVEDIKKIESGEKDIITVCDKLFSKMMQND